MIKKIFVLSIAVLTFSSSLLYCPKRKKGYLVVDTMAARVARAVERRDGATLRKLAKRGVTLKKREAAIANQPSPKGGPERPPRAERKARRIEKAGKKGWG